MIWKAAKFPSNITCNMKKPPFLAPDIETSSDNYRSRFAGELGAYFLKVQADTVISLLPATNQRTLKILEIGGGHCQLVEALLKTGHEVWVHGSSAAALTRVHQLQKNNTKLHVIESSMYALPFENSSFDVVLNVRVIAHVNDLRAPLKEWTRLASKRIIFDYPPLESFNLLYPFLFGIKKLIEDNTRVFETYRSSAFREIFSELGWRIAQTKKQFFLPMVLHRALRNPGLSEKIENCCEQIKLTSLFGSPAVVAAEPK